MRFQDPPGTKLGRGMLFAALVLAMVLLTLLFQGVEDHQRNPNREPESTVAPGVVEVVLERNRGGQYLFSGSINGKEVEFLVDTGASDVVIPSELAEELGLALGVATRAMTANGPTTVYATRLDELRIGAIRLHDLRASVNAGAQPGVILLGMSALRHIEFSQQGDRLTLRQLSN